MDPFGTLDLAGEAATLAFAGRLAPCLAPGDVLALSGEIGAGKSVLARALIRARLGDPAAEVPSPSYTLVQAYAAPGGEIWHADLYRLSAPEEADELGLWAAQEEGAILLIEWPERLAGALPPSALTLRLEAGSPAHRLTLLGAPAWRERLEAALDPV
ncbi:tRNA (adenosine(37)-N6)-threonylcarbamoyltransferase complex ATPase subunit type 1 TsaE [Pseudoroseicyclus sp. CXY001]|uniref:tRNA (adenosine(37)-N6)-threonylcarbamoyltransferase complex ATPase subunit type 1 TsaE n=1 Tax=Pseudoroseicyclus sp. CXY001 TaxID=3242492 RepID=UPI003570AB05